MKEQPKKVVYTAVFGNYDTVLPVKPEWGCEFICFTDNKTLVAKGWKVVVVSLDGQSPIIMNRFYKILPHKFFEEYDQSLYVDGNVKILVDPSFLFEKYLTKGNISIPRHQDRSCLYSEAKLCMNAKKIDVEMTTKQLEKYSQEGFPENYGMTENGIILRNHKDNKIIDLMESWWCEFLNGGRRDQISLPFLVWKKNINIIELTEGPRINNTVFELALHSSDKSKTFIQRLARVANGKKHLHWYYLLLSSVVSFFVITRDRFRA